MTKQALLARIQELNAIRDGHLGQANAAQGAIQECGFWIEQLDQQEAQAAQEAQSRKRKR